MTNTAALSSLQKQSPDCLTEYKAITMVSALTAVEAISQNNIDFPLIFFTTAHSTRKAQ
jgi:hypothetical protein